MIDNVVVNHSKWQKEDIGLLFEDEPVHFTNATCLSVLMKELGIFKSTSEARRAGRFGPIPEGFTFEFKASKKVRLWIWNPTD
jgi:hypothetical protein